MAALDVVLPLLRESVLALDTLNPDDTQAQGLIRRLNDAIPVVARAVDGAAIAEGAMLSHRDGERSALQVLANVVNSVVACSDEWVMRQARELVERRASDLLKAGAVSTAPRVNAAPDLADALEALYLINSDEIGTFDPTPEFESALDKARAALRLAGRLP